MTIDTTDQMSALRTAIVRIVHHGTGLHERLALPIAEAILGHLQQNHGGRPLYIPAPGNAARDQAIRDAAAMGLTVSQIAEQHNVHRCTVYRVLKAQ